MDGTILDSNLAHYTCYKKVFDKYNKSFLDINQWNHVILNDNIDNYLQKEFGDGELFYQIKQEKRDMLKDETILFTKNSDVFIKFLTENDFNFCIVTNSNKATVEIFKEKLPLLKNIKQLIYREDYEKPKPHAECYEIAKQKYYKNEKYIIGFEDSMVGYNALKYHTDLIYVYKNEDIFKQNDCYLFDDYTNVFGF
jgi:beta-phosphoglucomutase-like phosphatase (HAD superfamily)